LFSKNYVQKQILRLTDEELEQINMEIQIEAPMQEAQQGEENGPTTGD